MIIVLVGYSIPTHLLVRVPRLLDTTSKRPNAAKPKTFTIR